MPQTFPMALADFFEGLPIRAFKPDLTEAMAFSRTKGGEVLTADMGPRLWTNEIIIGTNYYNRIEQVRARLNLLRSAGRSLLVHSMPLKGPQYDPLGSILGASTITLTTVAANNREINLAGFPVGYQLRPGDSLSFTYGSNPLRYAMHQVVNIVTASAGGAMTGVEVVDFIRPGFTLGTQVRLIKPTYKAIVLPGSTEVGESGDMVTQGLKFTVLQTLGR